ncbi:hypothetical protein HWV62_5933 [Athelia sp. TMB]|nr:hypothetical protein HWV62_5933 [Athelia sp. TMB]
MLLQTEGSTPVQTSETSQAKDWKTVGTGAMSLVQTPNTATSYLGLDDRAIIKQGLCLRDKQPARLFAHTAAGAIFESPAAHHTALFQTVNEFHLQNGDRCTIGQFVIARQGPEGFGATTPARVEEILQVKGSEGAEMTGFPDFVLLRLADASVASTTYHMPHLKLTSQWRLVKFATILCTVNTPHNCADHACGIGGSRPIYQEREMTNSTRSVVSHIDPYDVMLNTAQMRDALHVQKFRMPAEILDEQAVITASVAREIDLRKAAKQAKQSEKTAQGKSRRVLQPQRLAALQESSRPGSTPRSQTALSRE